ncbi:MAG: 23S rRNA (pseudouridine(1915)-N(3))-methyltransferase RlmH [Nitrospirota bacterium]
MRIRILWVGKTRERYLSEGIEHYLKRLRPMADISVVEIKEEKGKSVESSLSAEGRKIVKQADSYILLDQRGREFTSVEFAGLFKDRTKMEFVIGGPYGVSDEVRDNAADIIALSKMTFTHEMARLIFLEQLYRSLMIREGRGYHH